ncbi:MAG TPA: response regulator [Bryobacteraceae bacterium]|nr:response regulator [Bryobacteraceae bacterium]
MAFNVLIVDDSPAMRSFIARVLDLSGFPVGNRLEASNGEEALLKLAENWVDIVLTDLNMPGMDGEQLVRRLEKDEMLRSIPVVIISTDRTESRVHQMMMLGAKGYVKKPFLPETLRRELENVLGVGGDDDDRSL